MSTQPTQPEALRLADAIDPFTRQKAPDHLTSKVAADELRRLHARVVELEALAPAVPAVPDGDAMALAESVGLIGPASRIGDLHAAVQRYHDLICANATIKAAKMAADVILAVKGDVLPLGTVESGVPGAGGFHVRLAAGAQIPAVGAQVYAAPQPEAAEAMRKDAERNMFDAGWKACARFCDRDDVIFDGCVGDTGCPQFEDAFDAALSAQGGV